MGMRKFICNFVRELSNQSYVMPACGQLKRLISILLPPNLLQVTLFIYLSY